MTAPDNRTRMQEALARWEAEAAELPGERGALALESRAVWFNSQFNRLDRACAANEPAPEHLEGLSAFDLANARDRMHGAALKLRGNHA